MKLFKGVVILGLGALSLFLGANASVAESLREGWIYQGWPQWHPQKGRRPLASAGTQFYFGEAPAEVVEECPPVANKGTKVDAKGCPMAAEPVIEPVRKPAPPKPVTLDGSNVLTSKNKCPDPPKGAMLDTEECWIIRNVNFRTDRWDIPASAYPTLNEVARVLKQNPGLSFEIRGHTDDRASAKHNMTLSSKRANSVRDYLVKHGAPAARLSSKGFGLTRPIANNKTSAGRAENRRVELVALKQ
ncbi:MAG: OmpA family protein [Magnetococcales bacterium]|nr:OmpA family protein [Magnetococcales bacterium]